MKFNGFDSKKISTHSRAKAAGLHRTLPQQRQRISTHSRAKAAGQTSRRHDLAYFYISTHSRAKAAGRQSLIGSAKKPISTHSRAKAAGSSSSSTMPACSISTHSRAKAAGLILLMPTARRRRFQLTAARRRLV